MKLYTCLPMMRPVYDRPGQYRTDSENRFVNDRVIAATSDTVVRSPEEIDFMDVSPKQLVSVATAMILS